MPANELEPFVGPYDWDEGFKQNPTQPVFAVSAEERGRFHGLGVHVVRPRKPTDTTTWFAAV